MSTDLDTDRRAPRPAVELEVREWSRVLYALDCFAVGACGIPDERLPADQALELGARVRRQLGGLAQVTR